MGSVLFMTDMEEGHLFPTFGLGKRITDRGHTLTYAGVPDNEAFVTAYGFDFIPILGQKYPEGFRARVKQQHEATGVSPQMHLLDMVLNGEFDRIYQLVRPDVVIFSVSLSLEALLVSYRYTIKPFIFTPYLFAQGGPLQEAYQQLTSHTLHDLFRLFSFLEALGNNVEPDAGLTRFMSPLDQFIELVACPRQLDFFNTVYRPTTHHLGPCIRRTGATWDQAEHFQTIRQTKKIIFAAMGSQAHLYGERGVRLFNLLLTMMAANDMQDFHLILSSTLPVEPAGGIPPNVSLFTWVPQPEVLRQSAVAIIHGGLGSVKECIYSGVPMIVLPHMNDQPPNAKRVELHNLGLALDPETVTADVLKTCIRRVLSDSKIQKGIQEMKTVFQRQEQAPDVLELMEAKMIAPAATAASLNTQVTF